MATTFKYEVSPYKRKDGMLLIKIRMIHNKEVVRKSSSIYVSKDQLSRDLTKIKDYQVLDLINTQLEKLRKLVMGIEDAEFYKAEDLWNILAEKMNGNDGFRLDFFEYAESKMASMEPKTAEGYKTSINALKRFLKSRTLDVNDITYKMLVDFRDFLESEPALKNGKGKHQSKGKGSRAISYYLSCLRHIHNLAREEFNDEDIGQIRIPRQPFRKGLIPPQPITEHRTLTVSQMKALATVELRQGSQAALARDVFMLSFAMIGENTIDLYHATADEVEDGIQTYNRRKTDSVRADNALMQVRIEPEAEAFISRYHAKDGQHLFNFHARYIDHKNFNNMVNKGLKKVADAINAIDGGERVPDGLNFYYARHTWATIARNECGVSFDEVHESLNHAKRGSDRVTDIYVERDFSRVWEANRKVLDLVLGNPKANQ